MVNVWCPPSGHMTSKWRHTDVASTSVWRYFDVMNLLGQLKHKLIGCSLWVFNWVPLHTVFHKHLPIVLIYWNTVQKDVKSPVIHWFIYPSIHPPIHPYISETALFPSKFTPLLFTMNSGNFSNQHRPNPSPLPHSAMLVTKCWLSLFPTEILSKGPDIVSHLSIHKYLEVQII